MNIKLLFISLLTVLTYGKMSAEQLTPSEALARVTDSQQNSQIAQRVRRAKATNQLRLAFTSTNANDNTFYVYNNANEGGFILVSADDCVPSLIGYTEKGAFDYDALPSNVKWYLAYFDSQVKRQVVSGRKSVARASRTAVSPLLGKTVWDQSTPFNDLCPTYNNEHALTGCVATAMAQVMRYHKWPKRGNGSITYTFDFAITESKTVSKTISNYSFDHALDWDNMIDYYSEDKNYTSAQGKAVAQLMADCGAAAQAEYGLEAANGTGALSENAANGMAKYLGYDSGIKVVYQEDEGYTQAQFENLVYTELAANRPVILGGNGETGEGGHEFVCDGCNASGLFHINWGWSGMYDGYFALSGQGLVPEGTGSGGAAEGDSYGYQLEAIVGIKPNGSSSATDPTDPDTPETPETPDEPEDPDTPDDPEDPSDPSDSDTPIIPQGTIFGEVLDQITVDKTTLNPTTSGSSNQTLTLSSSKGIKVSNYDNYYLDMGVEFIDMATGQASDRNSWLVNFGEYNGQMDSKGNAFITSITVGVPAGLQAGHKYTVTPVIWRDLDEDLSGNSLHKAMWNQREYPKVTTASYLPVITIAGGTAIVDINSANTSTVIYDIQGRVVTSGSLAPGLYIMNGKKILKK